MALVHAQEHKTIVIGNDSVAAIAYSPSTGKYGYAYDRRSRKAAEDGALKDCGAADATITCWVKRGFCALALGSDKSYWGSGWKYGAGCNSDAAKEQALEECKNRTSGARIAVVMSSDGQAIWDQRDHTTITDKDGNVYDGRGNVIRPTSGSNASANTNSSVAPSANPPPAKENSTGSMLEAFQKKKQDDGSKK